MLSKTHNIRGLSIYLIDSSDIPSIYALAKEMAVYFPQISWLNLWFERRCNIVSFLLTVYDYNLKIIKPLQKLIDEFSFFSNLREVYTYVQPQS